LFSCIREVPDPVAAKRAAGSGHEHGRFGGRSPPAPASPAAPRDGAAGTAPGSRRTGGVVFGTGDRAASDPAAAPSPPWDPRAGKPRQRDQTRRAPRDGGTDRGLRDLVGAGRSQVGVGGALRARDVNRPTDEDLAAAEAEVEIVRRNWKPRADG